MKMYFWVLLSKTSMTFLDFTLFENDYVPCCRNWNDPPTKSIATRIANWRWWKDGIHSPNSLSPVGAKLFGILRLRCYLDTGTVSSNPETPRHLDTWEIAPKYHRSFLLRPFTSKWLLLGLDQFFLDQGFGWGRISCLGFMPSISFVNTQSFGCLNLCGMFFDAWGCFGRIFCFLLISFG